MEQVATDPGTATPTLRHEAPDAEASRRQELADFLRARRQALSPEEAGLPPTRRRRVRGLRREEVAEMAGISVAWYTWIEQARDLNLSESTLHSVSRALRLNSRECEHLFLLAGHPAPTPYTEECEQVMDSVRQVIDSINPNPAYVLDTRWDILAWNRGAEELFGDFNALPESRRNFVWLTFAGRFRSLYVNWEQVARCVIAHFRSDSVRHVGDLRWLQLVDELNQVSPEFRAWWPNHHVAWPMRWQKQLLHPTKGPVSYNAFDLELFRPARLRIVTYIPAGNQER